MVRLGGARKVGVFLFSWPNLTGPGRQSNGPKFWIKLFLETRWSPASIEPLLDLCRLSPCLTMSGTKVMAQKPHFTPKIRKCMNPQTYLRPRCFPFEKNRGRNAPALRASLRVTEKYTIIAQLIYSTLLPICNLKFAKVVRIYLNIPQIKSS